MRSIVFVFAALAAAGMAGAQPTPRPAAVDTDPELKAFWQVADQRFPRPGPGLPHPREQVLARDVSAQKTFELGRALIAKHPPGPVRTWVILVLGGRSVPLFIQEIKAGYEDQPESADMIVSDLPRQKAVAAEVDAWLQEVRRDPATVPEARSQACFHFLRRKLVQARSKTELNALCEELEKMVAGHELTESHTRGLYYYAIWNHASYGTSAFEAYLVDLASHQNETARKMGAEARETLKKQRAGLDWLKFTALDGREVDLAKLRGKVVLVDFGATWCVPCIEEIPGMKAAYEKYHDKGFEVITLSLEDAGITPSDTPEQVAAKTAAAKRKLEAFVAKQSMRWPVYFETHRFQNEFCARLGITGIPAMFLVDQEGRVVSTAARGEALERELRTLLKL